MAEHPCDGTHHRVGVLSQEERQKFMSELSEKDLASTYREVRKSIVAFVPRHLPLRLGQKPPVFPPIVGTGFIIDDGIVVTNNHVVRRLAGLPQPAETPPDQWPFVVLLLH